MSKNEKICIPINDYREEIKPGHKIPEPLLIEAPDILRLVQGWKCDSGVFLGLPHKARKLNCYAGKSALNDGNIAVFGVNGSGKSRYIAKSTLATWRLPIVALDIKGELSEEYSALKRKGLVNRPYIVFDPLDMQQDSDPCKKHCHYDPFADLDSESPDFAEQAKEIAYAIIPALQSEKEQYWSDIARDFFTAAIIYCFHCGMDFIETVLFINTTSPRELCERIKDSDDMLAKMFISDILDLKKEHSATISVEVKRYTMPYATDQRIQNALSKSRYSELLSWDVMNQKMPNVFLRLRQDRLEQWGGMIRLMLVQLIRKLERRPDMFSRDGRNTFPYLIMLDEFPMLGKVDTITNALTTLRSKNVTFCLMLQSLAQLDRVYGTDTRRIIVDNCQYKVILNITEPDSQEYFSRLIGTVPTLNGSASLTFPSNSKEPVLTRQAHSILLPRILPHEFAANQDIWLHTPYGFSSTIKKSIFHLL